jgi:hypothetical protein
MTRNIMPRFDTSLFIMDLDAGHGYSSSWETDNSVASTRTTLPELALYLNLTPSTLLKQSGTLDFSVAKIPGW